MSLLILFNFISLTVENKKALSYLHKHQLSPFSSLKNIYVMVKEIGNVNISVKRTFLFI